MKETRMPPAYSANLVANSGNTIYGVSVIEYGIPSVICGYDPSKGCSVSELRTNISTSNMSWCMGIKGEMSGTVCVTFTWDMYIYIYMSSL